MTVVTIYHIVARSVSKRVGRNTKKSAHHTTNQKHNLSIGKELEIVEEDEMNLLLHCELIMMYWHDVD